MKRKPAILVLISLLLLIGASVPLGARIAAAQTDARGLRVQPIQRVSHWPGASKRWALVIGVDQYKDRQIGALTGAANDARLLAEALIQRADFPPDQVVLLATDQPEERQPTRMNILRRLSNFAAVVPKDGLFLLSFSGHGMERGGEAFLLPSDAQLADDVSILEDGAVNVERVKDRIKAMGARQVVLLLDACRNDPGGRADAPNLMTESYARGFNFDVRNREVEAFATLYAASIGQRAYEYTEKRQGYFTWAVIEALKGEAANEKGEVTLAALIRYVQDAVPKKVSIDLGASKRQKPYYQMDGYKADELVIAIAARDAPIATDDAVNPRRVDPAAIELSFWETIKTSTNPEDFRAYLRKYPNGQFADLARIRAKEPPSAPVTTEVSANTAAVAREYVKNGDALVDNGRLADAEREYRGAVQAEPGNAVWRHKLYRVMVEQTKQQEARDELRRLRQLNKWAEIEAEERRSVQQQPANARRHVALAAALAEQQKYSEAEAEFRRAASLDPRNVIAYTGIGLALAGQRKYADAEAEYRQALKLDPGHAPAHVSLGAALGNQQKYAEAEAEYREAIRLDPGNSSAHNGLGISLARQQKYAEAEGEYRQAMKLDPNEPRPHYNLALAFANQQKFNEAETEYREALRLDPEYVLGHRAFGRFLSNRQRYAEAEGEYRQVIRLEPRDARAHNELGRALEMQKKYVEAEAEYRQALKIDPKLTDAQTNLNNLLQKK